MAKLNKNEWSLRDFWNYNKRSKIHVIGVLEGKEKDSRAEKILEDLMAKYYSNSGKTHKTSTTIGCPSFKFSKFCYMI